MVVVGVLSSQTARALPQSGPLDRSHTDGSPSVVPGRRFVPPLLGTAVTVGRRDRRRC